MNYNNIYSCGSSFSCAGGLNWNQVQSLYIDIHDIKIDNNIDYA